jgi:hypothetical protein
LLFTVLAALLLCREFNLRAAHDLTLLSVPSFGTNALSDCLIVALSLLLLESSLILLKEMVSHFPATGKQQTGR